MKEIVFFGDSLTAGYGLQYPDKESMPALITAKIDALSLNFSTVNAGISGDTTRSALARITGSLKGNIEIFIIELGANDFLRGIDAYEVRKNLQLIIDKVKRAYPLAKILLLGIELPAWALNSHGQAYANIFTQLAKENKAAMVASFLKGVTGNRALNMFDGVHPLAAGYVIAAENIWPTILALIQN